MKQVVDDFHALYLGELAMREAAGGGETWMGVQILKCPLDLWVYQEILFEVRPDLIIETGTYLGGSALYLSHLCELLGKGRVLSIDLMHRGPLPTHPRIEYLQGSSVDPAILASVRQRIRPEEKVLVILDSDHHAPHVLEELKAYAPLVTRGSYLIVEDTNLNGHPIIQPGFEGEGPTEALERFLPTAPEFERDQAREKLLFTFNPGGFLKKVA
jgi:cephalosporin hydroxylase